MSPEKQAAAFVASCLAVILLALATLIRITREDKS